MNLFGETEPARCEHNQIKGTFCSLCAYEAERVTNEAISQAEQNATKEWMDYAWEALKQVAYQNKTLTTDDIWAILDRYPNIQTHEPRAMGAIMRKAVKHKWIRKTGNYVTTRRPIAHQKPIAVWESLAFDHS